MKKYECLYIVNINYDSEGISAVVSRVEELLKSLGGEVKNTQHWGKRKLAYAIDKERYGNYVLIHFEGENPDLSEFHRELEIEAGVLHYMTIRLDAFPDFDTLSVPQTYEADQRPNRRGAPGASRRPRYNEDEDDAADDSSDDEVEETEAAPEKPASKTAPQEDAGDDAADSAKAEDAE